MPLPVVLTIAGSDSSAGAGIQADLKTFAALKTYGTSVITAITAQNTQGVDSFERVSPELVYAQIQSVASDLSVRAVKTGMLVDAEIIAVTAAAIRDLKLPNLIVDTVMVAKSGQHLLAADATQTLISRLLPQALLITPNIPEAEVMTGMHIKTVQQMRDAAKSLVNHGARNILLKGGHLHGAEATDIFFDGNNFTELTHTRITTNSTHGTGCTLSAAITAYLAHGESLLNACKLAKQYLTAALVHSQPLGHGHGPVNHFWALE